MTLPEFSTWIEKNQEKCIRFVVKRFKYSREVAEDVFQEQCLITCGRIKNGETFTYFSTWFHEGLLFCSLNYRSTNKKYEFGYEFHGSSDNTPEANVLNKELTVGINKGIAWLGPKQQEVIKSYYFEDDMSFIGSTYENTFKANKLHAIRNLRYYVKRYVTNSDTMCYDYSELSAVPGLRE